MRYNVAYAEQLAEVSAAWLATKRGGEYQLTLSRHADLPAQLREGLTDVWLALDSAGRVQAWVAGPGMGTGDDAAELLRAVLRTDVPVLVDADGLTVLAAAASGVDDLDDLADSGVLARPTLWLFGNEASGLPPEVTAVREHFGFTVAAVTQAVRIALGRQVTAAGRRSRTAPGCPAEPLGTRGSP